MCCAATHTITTDFGIFSLDNDLLIFAATGGYLPIWNTSTIDTSVMADTKRKVAFERLFDLAATAQYLLFSRALHSHNPDLVQIQMRTFLTYAKKEREAFRTKTSPFCHLPSTKNSTDSHVLLISSIIFRQIPDESSNHLLAPVRQLSNGKQRSIHDCTIATSTQEPETTLHRN